MTFVRAADGRSVLRAALVLGLVLRAAIFWHTPGLGLEIVDEQHYVALARNILDGHGFAAVPGQPTSIRPPLFPAMVAAIFSIAGQSNLQAVRLVQFVIALLTTVLVYQLGRRIFTPAVGRYAAAATWLYPSLIFFNFTILTETLYIFLLLAFVLAAVRLIEKPAPGVALVCGIALGLSCLTRSVLWPLPILLCPLLAIVLRGPLRMRFAAPALVLAGYALVITPWAVRNTRLQGVLTVVDTMGAFNLRMGNYEHTPDDRMWTVVELMGERNWAHALNVQHPNHRFTEGQKAEWAQREALAYMAANPAITVRRAWIKFADFWGLERELAAAVQRGMYRPPRWFAVVAPLTIIVTFCGVALLGVAGVWLVRARDWRADLVVLLPVVAIMAAHTIVFGHSRYHIPLIPILALYGAALARDLILRLAHRERIWTPGFQRRTLELTGAVASVALLLVVWGRQLILVDAQRILRFLDRVS
jgi:4-amino-4-deoxy-L-arabinose transferase-like glycosyltransferase